LAVCGAKLACLVAHFQDTSGTRGAKYAQPSVVVGILHSVSGALAISERAVIEAEVTGQRFSKSSRIAPQTHAFLWLLQQLSF
jgi:hypothetical protein